MKSSIAFPFIPYVQFNHCEIALPFQFHSGTSLHVYRGSAGEGKETGLTVKSDCWIASRSSDALGIQTYSSGEGVHTIEKKASFLGSSSWHDRPGRKSQATLNRAIGMHDYHAKSDRNRADTLGGTRATRQAQVTCSGRSLLSKPRSLSFARTGALRILSSCSRWRLRMPQIRTWQPTRGQWLRRRTSRGLR